MNLQLLCWRPPCAVACVICDLRGAQMCTQDPAGGWECWAAVTDSATQVPVGKAHVAHEPRQACDGWSQRVPAPSDLQAPPFPDVVAPMIFISQDCETIAHSPQYPHLGCVPGTQLPLAVPVLLHPQLPALCADGTQQRAGRAEHVDQLGHHQSAPNLRPKSRAGGRRLSVLLTDIEFGHTEVPPTPNTLYAHAVRITATALSTTPPSLSLLLQHRWVPLKSNAHQPQTYHHSGRGLMSAECAGCQG